MDTGELAFRAVYCYLLENEKRKKLNLDRILESLHITEEDAERYREQEREFQKFVTGNRMAMAEIRDLLGCRMMVPQKQAEKYQDSEAVNRVQIYEDRGEGFREEESRFVPEAYQGENRIELELTVSGEVQVLRIDPAFDSCVVRIEEMTFNGEPVPLEKKKVLQVNGRIARPATLIFPTTDPNINIDLRRLSRQTENSLRLCMEIVRLSTAMAQEMADAVKKLI